MCIRDRKELADVRDAQARRPASPRSPRSPRTPRADESALEKLSDQLSSLQATIAAPPRAIEERRRTYATITSDLEQLKRNRGEQGSTRERNSQLQRLISRPFSTRFG